MRSFVLLCSLLLAACGSDLKHCPGCDPPVIELPPDMAKAPPKPPIELHVPDLGPQCPPDLVCGPSPDLAEPADMSAPPCRDMSEPPADLSKPSCAPLDLSRPDDDPDCSCNMNGHGLGTGHCHDGEVHPAAGHGNGHCKYDC